MFKAAVVVILINSYKRFWAPKNNFVHASTANLRKVHESFKAKCVEGNVF